MFERFTDDARHVVVVAQEQSRVLCNDYIGPEHLLLALAADPDTIAGRVLGVQGVTFKRAREVVVAHHGTGDTVPSGNIPFTAEAKAALEGALRACEEHGDSKINPGHLLLGLLQAQGAIADAVLKGLEIAVADTIERAEVLLEQHNPAGATLRQRLTQRVTGSATPRGEATTPGPCCANCHADFPSHLRRTTVALDAAEDDKVSLLWCTNCGATLSASGD